ncbi:MAG: alpha/beta hydrolase [Treponema sp.]|nr:alpha/beta hydrolase [Treponema sp.]
MKHYKNPSEQKLIEAGITEKTARVGDVDFNYAEGRNNGPALLLLHAQTLDWFTYSKALPALSKKFHVFAVDYPGHGKTQCPDNYPMTAGRIGMDLANFIETVIKEPVFASGNSSGGLLTVWLAANRPDLVKAVVLEDPPLFSSEYPEIKQTVADKLFTASYKAVQDKQYGGNFLDYWIETGTEFFRTYTGPLSQPLIKFVVNNYKKANPGKPVAIAFLPISVEEMLRGLNYYDPRFGASFHDGTWNRSFDHADALAKIQCPAVLIHARFEIMENGVLNGAMNQEQANRAVSLIPNCQYIKVEAGHVTNLEAPEGFIQIIEGHFLIGQDAPKFYGIF